MYAKQFFFYRNLKFIWLESRNYHLISSILQFSACDVWLFVPLLKCELSYWNKNNLLTSCLFKIAIRNEEKSNNSNNDIGIKTFTKLLQEGVY